MPGIARLRDFVMQMTALVDQAGGQEAMLLDAGGRLLQDLVRHDDWLPEAFTIPHPAHYQQYLLHCDPLERFSVVSFVWGPGQQTPMHDHTVWGIIGMLRGMERCSEYTPPEPGAPMVLTAEHVLRPGEIDRVSPTVGDVHRVANADPGGVSISIHVYGANIGAVRRHVFDPGSGQSKDFISGYASDCLPNLWDRSAELNGTD